MAPRIGSRSNNWKHGLTATYLGAALKGIRQRCNNPSNPAFERYGGRGIECRIKSPVEILEAIGHRPTDKHSIDRIDNDGHYEIGNIRWATRKEQSDNSRQQKRITHNGKTQCMNDWARELGLSRSTLRARIRNWGIDKALTTPRQRPMPSFSTVSVYARAVPSP